MIDGMKIAGVLIGVVLFLACLFKVVGWINASERGAYEEISSSEYIELKEKDPLIWGPYFDDSRITREEWNLIRDEVIVIEKKALLNELRAIEDRCLETKIAELQERLSNE